MPAGLWLNSFHHGLSGGERLVKPEEYRKLLGLPDDQDASTTFVTFSFDWQPDHVSDRRWGVSVPGTACARRLARFTCTTPPPLLQVNWYANGVPLLRRHYGELISWTDMKVRRDLCLQQSSQPEPDEPTGCPSTPSWPLPRLSSFARRARAVPSVLALAVDPRRRPENAGSTTTSRLTALRPAPASTLPPAAATPGRAVQAELPAPQRGQPRYV